MTIPTISTLPTAPARTDPPATFISRADAFLAALVTMQSELNTSIGAMNTDIAQVNTDATNAAASAVSAAASEAAAEAASNATLWVSGTSYSAGDVVYSPVDYKSYRANTATSGTTDPSASADWTALGYELPTQTGNSGKFLTTDGTDESWASVSGGLALLNTYSVTSAVASIIVDDFTSDYDDYIILIDKLSSANNDQDFNVQMELDGSYQTSNYSYAGIRIDSSLTYYNSTSTTHIVLGKRTPDSPTSSGMTYPSYIVELSSVNDAAVHQGLKVTGQHLYFGTSYKFEGVGSYRNTTGILTGLKFYVASGNIATANIKIYGIKKAL